MFRTTSLHSSFVAVTPSPRAAMPLAAFMPIGVAAFPSPKRFALTFAESGSRIFSCLAASGNSRRSTGRSALASASAIPQLRMSSITAHQRHMTPPIERHSSTAACAPSSAASPTSAVVPAAQEYRIDTAIMPVQTIPISIFLFPLNRFLVKPICLAGIYEKFLSVFTSAQKN